MPLITGSAIGNVKSQEELYIEGAPYIYFQDYRATPQFNPDSDGYYYGLSGTVNYPARLLGCIQNVVLTEGVTMNDVRCDTIGVKDTIQKRDYIEFNLEILSMFPISTLAYILNLGATPTVGTNKEKVGIGGIDNTQKYMIYAPKVYDEINANWLLFHLHKAKFVAAWSLNMKYGAAWTATGLKIRAYADDTKLSTMRFGTIARFDTSGALP